MPGVALGTGKPMRRREFITIVGGAMVAWPLAARAQQSDQVRRIGVLMSAASETDQQAGVTVFLEVLHQLGWIDGHNVRVEIRWARGDPAEARRGAEELVALPADVIMVTGQLGLEALLQEGLRTDIPLRAPARVEIIEEFRLGCERFLTASPRVQDPAGKRG